MWQPYHHPQRLVKGASDRNVSDLHTAPCSFARTSVCQLAWRLLPRRWTEVLNVQKVLQKLCEPTYSECHRFNNLKEKNYAFFQNERVCFIVCLLFSARYYGARWLIAAPFPVFMRPIFSGTFRLFFLPSPDGALSGLLSHFTPHLLLSTRAFLRACTPQRACLQPALKTFPQEMNEVSETLLASSVQPMQT